MRKLQPDPNPNPNPDPNPDPNPTPTPAPQVLALVSEVAKHATARLDEFNPRDLANTAWALLTLGDLQSANPNPNPNPNPDPDPDPDQVLRGGLP